MSKTSSIDTILARGVNLERLRRVYLNSAPHFADPNGELDVPVDEGTDPVVTKVTTQWSGVVSNLPDDDAIWMWPLMHPSGRQLNTDDQFTLQLLLETPVVDFLSGHFFKAGICGGLDDLANFSRWCGDLYRFGGGPNVRVGNHAASAGTSALGGAPARRHHYLVTCNHKTPMAAKNQLLSDVDWSNLAGIEGHGIAGSTFLAPKPVFMFFSMGLERDGADKDTEFAFYASLPVTVPERAWPPLNRGI